MEDAKAKLVIEILQALTGTPTGSEDSGSDIQLIVHTFFAQVPSLQPGGDAVHLWMQSYPGVKRPSKALQQKIATTLFDSMVKEQLCGPKDIIVFFSMFTGSITLRATQVSHIDFAHPRLSKKALTRLWFAMVNTPLLSPTRTFVIQLSRSKEEIIHSHTRAVEPPQPLIQAMELAREAENTRVRELLFCTSNALYGAAGIAVNQAKTTHLFNAFMERFYATPGLVQTLLKIQEDKLPAPQIVHCRINEATLAKNAEHFYAMLPMMESPVWRSLDLNKMRGFKEHQLVMVLQIESEGRQLVNRTLALKDNVTPLTSAKPFSNYRIDVTQVPSKRVCAKCDLTKEFMSVCSSCKTVRYCSVKCQNEDWRARHGAMCKEIKAWLCPDSIKEPPLEVD